MQERLYTPAFVFSLVLHSVVLLMLIVSFEFSSQMPVIENATNAKMINAVVVDMPSMPIVNNSPQPAPPPSLPQQQIKPRVNPSDVAVQEAQKQRVIALKAQRLKQQKADALAKQMLDDLKKQAVKEKQAKQKTLLQAMEKELQEQAAKPLPQPQPLQQPAVRVASAKTQGEVNKYKALILQAISRRWMIPADVDKKLATQLLVRLAPGGIVLDVQITKSSGNAVLDRSARDAVLQASPLPVPADADAFNQFRQFALKAKPESVTVTDIG